MCCHGRCLEPTRPLHGVIHTCLQYTDQVISPRNTRLNVEIKDVSRPSSLCNKSVALKIRSTVTPSSLNRISSSHHFIQSTEFPEPRAGTVQGVWRRRGGSFGNECPLLLRDRKIAVHKSSSPATI